ncbi:FxsA family protein [Corynebacterium sp. MSK297]|uniref:FxsA family protein n=1 Tax=Corynebacterium sp. MSK297 TaxID=3050221 RepID=UPI002550AA74|nr:FxsA family protein [Corynebacterium sp. MSK297]MDK8846435.1 FxsA family protein [Corynebacterium sp. MSK297]
MPVVMFFFYILSEILAFWAVASLLGFGWAMVALLATVVLGIVITRIEVRRIAATQASLVQRLRAQRDESLADDSHAAPDLRQAGKSAGDIGLTLAGAFLLAVPGFATALLGLLLVFPLTRPIIRGFLLGRMQRSVEKFGVRFFEASPTGRKHASYGTFGFADGRTRGSSTSTDSDTTAPTSDGVLNEDELRQWAESMSPEDFATGSNNSENASTDSDDNEDKDSDDNDSNNKDKRHEHDKNTGASDESGNKNSDN